MKQIKKVFALLLALCFLAVIPLTAAADVENGSQIVGTWTGYLDYDAATGNVKNITISDSSLMLFANGTGVWLWQGKTYDIKWSFKEKDEDGFWFNFDAGNNVYMNLNFNPEGQSAGLLMLFSIDHGIVIYKKL